MCPGFVANTGTGKQEHTGQAHATRKAPFVAFSGTCGFGGPGQQFLHYLLILELLSKIFPS